LTSSGNKVATPALDALVAKAQATLDAVGEEDRSELLDLI